MPDLHKVSLTQKIRCFLPCESALAQCMDAFDLAANDDRVVTFCGREGLIPTDVDSRGREGSKGLDDCFEECLRRRGLGRQR